MAKILVEKSRLESILRELNATATTHGFVRYAEVAKEKAIEDLYLVINESTIAPVWNAAECRWDGVDRVQQCTVQPAPLQGSIWVLLEEYNDYDQHGEYFVHAWNHKPSKEELSEHVKGVSRPGVSGYLAFVLAGGEE